MRALDRWHEQMAEHPVSTEQFLSDVLRAGVRYGDSPLCIHRRPHFISDRLVNKVDVALGHFHMAVRVALNALLSEGLPGPPNSLVRSLGVPPEALSLASWDPGYESPSVIARVDCFAAGDHPWFLELNGESPAGIGYSDALSDLLSRDPLAESFPDLVPFDAGRKVVEAVLHTWQIWSQRTQAPRVAIVDFLDVPTRPEFDLLQRRFHGFGMPCTIVDPRELTYKVGRGQLVAHGQPIDVVYRRLLVADLLAHPRDCRALLQAYQAGAVCMVNSLRSALLHGKGLFALLHSPALLEKLSHPLQRMVRNHVPWTAVVSSQPGPCTPAGLLEIAVREQRDLVLKPMSGHGGAGVVLGWRVSSSEWASALAAADSHVLQRRVFPQYLPFPDATADWALVERLVDLAPFLVHGRLAGFLCRLSKGELANVSTGASQVPVFALPNGAGAEYGSPVSHSPAEPEVP
jgi:uncharacterized circularly permuted ATP-grasp superfamily protein